MKKVNLILGTCNRFPIGLPEDECERLYQRAFKPFLSTLYKFPGVNLTLHYSGIVFEWLQERHPEFLMLLNDMVKRKQVELLGGTYYDAVLPIIPSADRSGQIELLTTFLRKRFGRRPRGMWVTERAWEPTLPSIIKASGMEYLFLDDAHFAGAGLRDGDLLKPCLTEDQGKTLLVFPLSATVRIPSADAVPDQWLKEIRGLASERETRFLCVIGDGDEYGAWDDSYDELYAGGRLAEFLEKLAASADTIETVHPGAFWPPESALEKRYFRCSASSDSGVSQHQGRRRRDADRGRDLAAGKGVPVPPAHGGHFRQLLSIYPESNLMYAKMMHSHILVNQVRGDKYRKKSAREELWKGECIDAYWHGKTGGIHVNQLRKAVYRSLIQAEKTARQRGIFKAHIGCEDYDMDGCEEYLIHGTDLNAYIHSRGASVFELDYLPVAWNYLDTLSRRRPEADDSTEGSGSAGRRLRRAFVDHFLDPAVGLEAFEKAAYVEAGDLIDKPYQVVDCRRDHLTVVFSAQAGVRVGGVVNVFEVQKSIGVERSSVVAAYRITNTGSRPARVAFAAELNVSLLSEGDGAGTVEVLDGAVEEIGAGATVEKRGARSVAMRDSHNDVEIGIALSVPCDLWQFPVRTEWAGRDGIRSGYQSTCVVPRWILDLGPSEAWSGEITVRFRQV